jgi:hypothetical protein
MRASVATIIKVMLWAIELRTAYRYCINVLPPLEFKRAAPLFEAPANKGSDIFISVGTIIAKDAFLMAMLTRMLPMLCESALVRSL